MNRWLVLFIDVVVINIVHGYRLTSVAVSMTDTWNVTGKAEEEVMVAHVRKPNKTPLI